MNEFNLALLSSFWLGILTSISPCPLATNIAAVSFVGRRIDSPWRVFLAGSLYTLGRALAYACLGIVLVSSMLSAPVLAHSLQKYLNLVLGPLLILVGMTILGMIFTGTGGYGISINLQKKFAGWGHWGAGLLGILFALSFCPTSAALFFGSLLPLALQQNSGAILPIAFGIATGIPVLIFAFLISVGAQQVSRIFDRIVTLELWARRVTGAIFIFTGFYLSLVHIYGISL